MTLQIWNANKLYNVTGRIVSPNGVVTNNTGTAVNTVYWRTEYIGNQTACLTPNETAFCASSTNTNNTYTYFQSDVISYSSYYPFGMEIGALSSNSESSRYGFNGMEKDDEVKGISNSYDYGARMYDNRLGKFMSLDAHAKNYASQSPYSYAANSPIRLLDIDGNDIIGFLKLLLTKQYGNSKLVLESEKFVKLLSLFASTTNGDKIGQKENGAFSDIDLVFVESNFSQDKKDDGIIMYTPIQVQSEGKWIDLTEYDGDFKGITKENFRVAVKYDLSQAGNKMDNILTIIHEVSVHTVNAGKKINSLEDNRAALVQFQAEYIESVTNQDDHYGIGSTPGGAPINVNYDVVVNDVAKALDVNRKKVYDKNTTKNDQLNINQKVKDMNAYGIKTYPINYKGAFFESQILKYNRAIEKNIDFNVNSNLSKLNKDSKNNK